MTTSELQQVKRILKDFDQLGFDSLTQAYNAVFTGDLDLWDFSGISEYDRRCIVKVHAGLAPNFNHNINA